MIKVNLSHIGNAKQDFYSRICNDGPHGYKGLVSRIKQKMFSEQDFVKVKFYSDLLQDVIGQKKRVSLVIAEPHLLALRIIYYNSIYGRILSDDNFRGKLLNEVFFYESYDKWQAYRWAKILKVDVCPYCNRQYTFTLDTNDGKTRPQFDHFYDKATFPYLSLSFYNLIPSCSICNSSLKGSDKFTLATHLHPYIDGFGNDIRFSIRPFNITFLNGNPSAYKIVFRFNMKDTQKARKAAANIRTFKLNALYNMHKDGINELIIKSLIYNPSYINSLYAQFANLFTSIDDVKRMIISNYHIEEDLGKRTLAKFYSDIAHELGLI